MRRIVAVQNGQASSAFTCPQAVHPEAVAAMEELGIGIGDRTPQVLTDELARWPCGPRPWSPS